MKYNCIITMCIFIINSANYKILTNAQTSPCKTQQFACKNRQCIDEELLCDGKADCLDKSDETSDICSAVTCPKFAYTCKYGACIHRKYKCNGVTNCIDNSDESDCSKRPETNPAQRPSPPIDHSVKVKKYICQSGETIDEELICDGEPDCSDRSDETENLCSNFHCPYFTFRCSYGACITLNAKCNGINNCNDASDEQLCSLNTTLRPQIPTATTPETTKKPFQCSSGEVIPEEFLCDGEPDCADQSDETVKECSKFHCPSFSYRCHYGACVLSGAKCNGIKECVDNSDETICSAVTLQTSHVLTETFKCNSGQKIDTDMVCDGKADCPDFSDENLITCSQINCPHFAYKCNYGACVHGTAKCNGITDCIDNSDEAFCPKKNLSGTQNKQSYKDYLVFS